LETSIGLVQRGDRGQAGQRARAPVPPRTRQWFCADGWCPAVIGASVPMFTAGVGLALWIMPRAWQFLLDFTPSDLVNNYVPVSEFFDSTLGIHSHRDDLIHVHPTSRSAAGRNARLGVFTDSSPLLDLSDDEISVGDESWKEGEDTCVVDGEEAPGEVVVARWEDVLDEEETPTVHSSGVEDLRFRADREGYVIAFVPEGEYGDIPKPHPTALELLPLTSRSLDDILPSDADELFDELDPYDIEDYNFEDFVGEGQNAGGTDAEDEDEAEEAPGPALPDEDGDNS
jgi:hypothetical protein